MEADLSRFLTLVKVAEQELLKFECREKVSSKRAAPRRNDNDSKRAVLSGFLKRKTTLISRKKGSVIPAVAVKSELTCQLDGLKLKISRKRVRVGEDEPETRPSKVLKLEPPFHAETFENPWGFSQPTHLGFAVCAY